MGVTGLPKVPRRLDGRGPLARAAARPGRIPVSHPRSSPAAMPGIEPVERRVPDSEPRGLAQ